MGVACHPAQWQASKQLNDLLAASVADINEHQLVAAEIDGPKYTTSVPLIIPLSFFFVDLFKPLLEAYRGLCTQFGPLLPAKRKANQRTRFFSANPFHQVAALISYSISLDGPRRCF